MVPLLKNAIILVAWKPDIPETVRIAGKTFVCTLKGNQPNTVFDIHLKDITSVVKGRIAIWCPQKAVRIDDVAKLRP